jgi:NitT/TauT family transport system ATP-binding protein
MLEFRDVSYSYAGRRGALGVEVLRNVSFSCQPDEIVAVIGPSGCGKSTLLSLAAGLREPSGGAVLVDGKRVHGPNRKIGMLFQSSTLLPWRSVEENVELGLEIRGEPKAKRAALAQRLIRQYGLAGFERKYPHALSGGMQKRAALIQTLAMEPEILLLDEPFAALDAQTRIVIENDVTHICRAGKRTMLLVTHDIAEAISMADRIIVLGKRPASVKAMFDVPFSRSAKSVADVPGMAEFSATFRKIWETLEISVPGAAESIAEQARAEQAS